MQHPSLPLTGPISGTENEQTYAVQAADGRGTAINTAGNTSKSPVTSPAHDDADDGNICTRPLILFSLAPAPFRSNCALLAILSTRFLAASILAAILEMEPAETEADDAHEGENMDTDADHFHLDTDLEPPCNENLAWIAVGQRVLIDGEDAGMIAQVSNYTGSVRIATDSGRWEFIHQLDVSRRLTQSSMPEGPGKVCAVNLDSSGVCLGVFLGFKNEKVFGGEAHAYLAHYSSKAVDRTVRTRTHGARTVGYTFAAGELVQQRLAFVEESGVRRQAVVVRVVYAPKSGRSSQIRKLLILFEVWLDGVSEPPSGCEPAFFPGSWTNWERVPESGSGWAEDVDIESPNAPCKRLKDELYPQVEEVSMMVLKPSFCRARCSWMTNSFDALCRVTKRS